MPLELHPEVPNQVVHFLIHFLERWGGGIQLMQLTSSNDSKDIRYGGLAED
jgi:hypothetical protein